MSRLLPLAAAAALVVAAAPAHAQGPIDEELRCQAPLPERLAPVLPGAAPAPIEVRVLVQLDGVTEAEAAVVMDGAARAYAPMGVDLAVARYEPVTLASDDLVLALEESVAAAGGRRPPRAHLVFTLTAKNLKSGGDPGVGGIAKCIGGIRRDEDAFAIGEYMEPYSGAGILDSRPDNGFRLAAHEIGHVLGGQHHHVSCVEDAAEDPAEATPCTLMGPNGLLNGRTFGALESSVIRAYAEDYAGTLAPVPAARRPARRGGRGGRDAAARKRSRPRRPARARS